MMRKLASLAVSIAALPAVLVALPSLAPNSFATTAALGPAQPGPGALTGQQVAAVARAAGFRGEALVIAVAIAGAESSWVGDTEGDGYPINECECHSHGLWEIRSCPHGDPAVTYDTSGCHPPLDRGDRATLLDPAANARAAYRLATGSRGWSSWSTFDDGRFEAWLSQAEAAAATVSTASPGATQDGVGPLDGGRGS